MNQETYKLISEEVARARAKFPRNIHMLAALMEEVGELAEVLLKNEGKERIVAEAKQVAAMAVRMIEEGDASFEGYDEANEVSK